MAGIALDCTDDDTYFYDLNDLNEFTGGCLLIAEGILRLPSDRQRGDLTIAQWVKRRVTARQFRDAVARADVMHPDLRGMWIRRALGDYDG